MGDGMQCAEVIVRAAGKAGVKLQALCVPANRHQSTPAVGGQEGEHPIITHRQPGIQTMKHSVH